MPHNVRTRMSLPGILQMPRLQAKGLATAQESVICCRKLQNEEGKMSRTNTMGYIPVVMDWTEKHRDRRTDGKLHWDAEPSKSGDAARSLKLRVLCAGDNPWTVQLPGMEAPNEFMGRLGVGDEGAMAALVRMLDWSRAEGTGRLDRECDFLSTHGAIPFMGTTTLEDGTCTILTDMASWGARASESAKGKITLSALLPVCSDDHRIPGVCRDFGADFVRRLSEEDRAAQAEIIDMIDCDGWNIRDVQISEWSEGRSLL